jgi:hypothetical protein
MDLRLFIGRIILWFWDRAMDERRQRNRATPYEIKAEWYATEAEQP